MRPPVVARGRRAGGGRVGRAPGCRAAPGVGAGTSGLPQGLEKLVGLFQLVPDPKERCVEPPAGCAAGNGRPPRPPVLLPGLRLPRSRADRGDARCRYKQLLFFATKLEAFPEEFRTSENKVEGCVSQVWVKPVIQDDGLVYFSADSDSQLTKGLAALLVQGLSGSSPAEILKVTPEFIEDLGLKQSLTPSRNNGFLNMLKKMQKSTLEAYMAAEKAKEAGGAAAAPAAGEEGAAAAAPPSTTRQMERILQENLRPTQLEITDNSEQHKGHYDARAGNTYGSAESHFALQIVSDEFEGLNQVKRHQKVYGLLFDLLEPRGSVHALQLFTKTPAEMQR